MSVAKVLNPLRLTTAEHASSTKTMDGLATPLKSVLTCSGCHMRYDDTTRRPKFLGCFHTLCLACVAKGFAKGKVKCPSCNHVTDCTAAESLSDNTQLCTILLNMSSLALNEIATDKVRDYCPVHSARINFWCDTCKMPLCRDCTVLAHRESGGHKVWDHDDAVKLLRGEIRRTIADTRTLHQETRRLRHDQKKYLIRQLDACRAFEKQLKSELKSLDVERKEENRSLERVESDSITTTSLVVLQEAAAHVGKLRLAAAQEFASAKAIIADKLMTLGRLNRSTDELDALDEKSSGSGSPASPLRGGDKKGRTIAGYCASKLLHNGRTSKCGSLRSTFSIDAPPPTIVEKPPKVFLEFVIEGIRPARVAIELRPYQAPKLCENFIKLCTGVKGFGYNSTKIFRCLPGWWVQGGDFDSNDGEGGRAAIDEEHLIPAENTELEPRPGAVEMLCMTANEKGVLMVGSQFFIHVKKYSYTHVFGYVVEGLDIIDRISHMGNPAEVYKPCKEITIVDCGLLKV